MHSFMLSPGGRFTTFEAPGAGTGAVAGQGTAPTPPTERGKIVGDYVDANNVYHAFSPARRHGSAAQPSARRE